MTSLNLEVSILRTSVWVGIFVWLAWGVGIAQDRAADLFNRATQLAAQGRYLEALPIARDAMTEAASRYGKQSVAYGNGLAGLGYLQMMTNDFSDAESNLTQGFEIVRAAVGDSSPQLANAMMNLAQLYWLKANAQSSNPALGLQLLQESEGWERRLLALTEKNYPADNANLITPIEGLCFTLSAERKFDEAKPLLQRALTIETPNFPPDHVQIIHTRNELGWILNQTGDRVGAIEQYRKALASAEKTLGPSDPVTKGIRDTLNQLNAGPGGGESSNANDAMLAFLHQAAGECSTSFRSYRQGEPERHDGDRIYSATNLPGATSCVVWLYKDKELGSRYRCKLGQQMPTDISHQTFLSLRNSLMTSFQGWAPHDSTSDSDAEFRVVSPNENCGVVLELQDGGRSISIAVDGR